jgi:Ca2+-binding EF-hand superfamily protein
LAEDFEDSEEEKSEPKSTLTQDEQLMAVIDNIWEKYDTDGNGTLDIDEARFFVKDILKDLGDDDGNVFQEEVYLAMFKSFDDDDSGTLEKDELHAFIKQLIDVDDSVISG